MVAELLSCLHDARGHVKCDELINADVKDEHSDTVNASSTVCVSVSSSNIAILWWIASVELV